MIKPDCVKLASSPASAVRPDQAGQLSWIMTLRLTTLLAIVEVVAEEVEVRRTSRRPHVQRPVLCFMRDKSSVIGRRKSSDRETGWLQNNVKKHVHGIVTF